MVIIQDLTRATGYGFCYSQLALFVFSMFYYPEPHATVYTTRAANATGDLSLQISSDEYGMAVVFLSASALCVVFALMTTQIQDTGIIDNMTEFSDELASQLYAWSACMWAIVMLGRLAMVALLCNPVDLYFLALVVLAQTYALQLMCSPRAYGKRADTVSLIIYMLVVGLVFVDMQARHGLRVIFWTAQIMSDVLLMVGHTYDNTSNMETVANCRVFYCCFSACLLILLYIANA
jgi:hypothetical protein